MTDLMSCDNATDQCQEADWLSMGRVLTCVGAAAREREKTNAGKSTKDKRVNEELGKLVDAFAVRAVTRFLGRVCEISAYYISR